MYKIYNFSKDRTKNILNNITYYNRITLHGALDLREQNIIKYNIVDNACIIVALPWALARVLK